MKTIRTIERTILTGLVALTLGIGLVPRAQAAVPERATMSAVQHGLPADADKPKAGEETHG